uniref:Putative tail protein n=2 Tax=viral metagenome TaxID=1070528 RepID=A0A6M3J350_9ZZZZ
MADLSKTVSIIFQGDDQISPALKNIDKKLSALSSGIGNVTGPLAGVADKILTIEVAAAALAAGGLAIATKTAGEFGDQFREISTLTDATGQDLDKFRGEILDYGRDSRKSYEEINASVYSAISAGTDYTKSLDLVSKAEKLSIAGKADLNSTTVLLASTLNAYGASVDQAEKYSDVFFKTVKLGQTTLPELAATLSNVTGVAASTGVPIETLSAALAALTASGQPTAQAVTGVKGALAAILKPSGEAAALAKELGIDFGVTALKTKGFEGVLNDAARATKGNTEQMSTLFGRVEALNSVLVLTGKGSEKFAAAMKEMQNASGATDAAFKKMSEGFALTNQRIVNNLKATLIEVGTPLLDEYGEIADGIVSVFKGLSIGLNAGAFDPVFKMLEKFGTDAAKYLQEVAKAMPEALGDLEFNDFIKSIDSMGGSLKASFKALFGDIDLTTPAGLAQAMQKIVDGFTALNNVTSGVIKGLEPFLEIIGKAIDKFSNLDAATQEGIGTVAGFAKGIESLRGVFDALQPVMYALTSVAIVNIGKTFFEIGKGAVGLAGNLTAALPSISNFIGAAGKGGLVGLSAAAGYGIGTLINEYVPGVKGATEGIIGLADKLLNFSGTQGDVYEKMFESSKKFGEVKDNVDAVSASIQAVPEKKETRIIVTADSDEALEVQRILDEMKNSKLTLTADVDPVKKAFEDLEYWHDGEWKSIKVPVETSIDAAALAKTKEQLEKEIPAEKLYEIKIKYEAEQQLAKLKADADLAGKAMEWTAKIKIEDAQASADKLKAIAAMVTETWKVSGEVIGKSLGILGDLDPSKSNWISIRNIIEKQMQAENQLRQQTFDLLQKQTEAEIALTRAKTERLSSGDGMIQIQADGMEPYIEAFMWAILEKIQIRANDVQSEFLLGVA